MTIYEIQKLVERVGSAEKYIPTFVPQDHIVEDFDHSIPPDAKRGKYGTATSFKPGNNNSKAVEAARQAVLGTKQTEDHKRKKAASRSRKVCVEGVIYNSGTEAAKALGVGRAAISNRIKRGHSAWLI